MEVFQHMFKEIQQSYLKLFSELYAKKKSLEQLVIEDFHDRISNESIEDYFRRLLSTTGVTVSRNSTKEQLFELIAKRLEHYANLFNVLKEIAEYKKKSFLEISDNDFFSTPLLEKHLDSADLINSQIEIIFYAYLNRKKQNLLLNYLNEKEGENNDVLSIKEFDKKYIAPWIIINKILDKHFTGLEVEQYTLKDFTEGSRIDIRFRKKEIPTSIQLSDLSSGEQIIIGLVLKLFTKEYYEGKIKAPKVLILDEPDAYLHPEMSKLLIEVLEDAFVKDLGIKVIITTHSASTIALAPEESIFVMDNSYNNCSLKKIPKDSALDLLTENIPTLSIDYKNHRQIFVESPTDVLYYQNVFNRLCLSEKRPHKLYFISNEKGNSNSAWVVDVVKQLREAGVSKAYGIVDWDAQNTSTESILVHGENARYSIENFIFDPLYLSTLFIEMDAHGIIKELSINPLLDFYNLKDLSNHDLQNRANWITNKIQDKFPALASEQKATLKYYDGKIIKIPDWYISRKGHELEDKIKITFPALGKLDTTKLHEKLTTILARSFPVVPYESIELLKKLST